MQEQILYILGAGASAEALPLAKSVYDVSEKGRKILKKGLIDELSILPLSKKLFKNKYLRYQ